MLPPPLGYPQTRVSKYELGTRRLDLLELRDVCEVLGMPLIDFVQAFDSAVAALEGKIAKVGKGSGLLKRRFESKPARKT